MKILSRSLMQNCEVCGARVSDFDLADYAEVVKTPTFVVQVHDDVMTKPYDIQNFYDSIPVEDKKLFWIEGKPVRHETTVAFPSILNR